ncbi:uncharacterized protein LOC105693085 [Athalia rosae]|uniref:uncharacterized protein LOC105693085 n=1 Tax=Athalia rosae TaxID=37344 RepID=UPI002033E6EA|nr:uncharacterized protein LOC105693085 [Athalia rosae]
MEVVIDCYFDKIFSEMERSSLLSRCKRRALVDWFTAIIDGCARGEELEHTDVCERAVQAALRYHNITLAENGSICLLGKFHNVLYIAAKLCFDWKIKNNDIVSRLLNDIYYCEKTFERIFIGAIFGTRVTHFLSGWKSDFKDREENIRALIYFMDHANEGRLEYPTTQSTEKCRFFDVSMESYGHAVPIKVVVQLGAPDILLLLLRYGANLGGTGVRGNSVRSAPSVMEMVLNKFTDFDDRNVNEKVNASVTPAQYPAQLVACLRILLRTVPLVTVNTPGHIAVQSGVLTLPLYDQYPQLVSNNLVPPERSGVSPPELKHLCRCRIRDSLFKNWALPHGIKELRIPQSLKDYLDLLTD